MGGGADKLALDGASAETGAPICIFLVERTAHIKNNGESAVAHKHMVKLLRHALDAVAPSAAELVRKERAVRVNSAIVAASASAIAVRASGGERCMEGGGEQKSI